jgi:hypothetical protein
LITSADEFVALRTSEDHRDSRRAAEEAASPEVWLDVIDAYPEMRLWVAHNKTVPMEILELLARDPDSTVRWTVATKGKLTVELLELLARDPDETVRVRVARNRLVATGVLRLLAQDYSWVVREAADQALMSREAD